MYNFLLFLFFERDSVQPILQQSQLVCLVVVDDTFGALGESAIIT